MYFPYHQQLLFLLLSLLITVATSAKRPFLCYKCWPKPCDVVSDALDKSKETCSFEQTSNLCYYRYQNANGSHIIQASSLDISPHRFKLPRYEMTLKMTTLDAGLHWDNQVVTLLYYCRSHGCNDLSNTFEVTTASISINRSTIFNVDNMLPPSSVISDNPVVAMPPPIPLKCSSCYTDRFLTYCSYIDCDGACTLTYRLNDIDSARMLSGSSAPVCERHHDWTSACVKQHENTKKNDDGGDKKASDTVELLMTVVFSPESNHYLITELDYKCSHYLCNEPMRVRELAESVFVTGRTNRAKLVHVNCLIIIVSLAFLSVYLAL